jgi:DNA-binding NtrC family response regulator
LERACFNRHIGALDHRRLADEVKGLRRLVGGPLAKLMGSSEVISRLGEQIARVAETDVTVLILGETGTGKELVARALHANSARRDGPFVALDCGAMPETLAESELFGHERGAFSGADRRREGHLQLAKGGTVLLDEVGNLSSVNQAKLLRALQERKVLPIGATKEVDVDVRFIAATNESLEGAGPDRTFREDLYHRLAEFVIRLPPLRERPEDIEMLARRFLDEACTEFRRPIVGFRRDAIAVFREHAWPGNVRELRNAVRQAALRCADREIVPGDIDLRRASNVQEARDLTRRAPTSATGTLKEIAGAAAAAAEREAIVEALRVAKGNKSEAARLLKTDFKTLHGKIKRFGLGGENP